MEAAQVDSDHQMSDDRASLALDTWEQFHRTRPLLYLPDRTPNADFDVGDRQRRLWTCDELAAFEAVVAHRSSTLDRHQQHIWRLWRVGATALQKVGRGFLGRALVARLRAAIWLAQQKAALEHARLVEQVRRLHAAHVIQRTYRAHLAFLALQLSCCQCIQRMIRLFLFRRRRWRAAVVIERVFRRYRLRKRFALQLMRVIKLVRLTRKREELRRRANQFHAAHCAALLDEAAALQAADPLRFNAYAGVQRRKQAITRRTLPLLRTARPSADSHAPMALKAKPKQQRTQQYNRNTDNQAISIPPAASTGWTLPPLR